MSNLRISRQAMHEVDRALEEYREMLAGLARAGTVSASTESTYVDRAERFVRWLRGEYAPGKKSAL